MGRERKVEGNFLLSKWCASHTNHSPAHPQRGQEGPDIWLSSQIQQKFSSWRTGVILELAEKLLLVLEGERAGAGNLHRLELEGREAAHDFIWCRCSWEVSGPRSCIVYQEEAR